MKVMKEYIKMSGRFLLHRFITAKFNFLRCIYNTLTQFSIFHTATSTITDAAVFFMLCAFFVALQLGETVEIENKEVKKNNEHKNEMLWKKQLR